MPHIYSLAYLTAPVAPPEALRLAAKLGYQAIGARIAPAMPGGDFAPLATDPAMLRDTIRAIGDTGVQVFDVEIIRLGPQIQRRRLRGISRDGRPIEGARGAGRRRRSRRGAADGDLRKILPRRRAIRPHGRSRIHAVDRGEEREPPRSASSPRPASRTAACWSTRCTPRDRPPRSTTSQLSPVSYAQLCDAPAGIPATNEELIHTARSARLLPGDGGIDLAGIIRPPAGRPAAQPRNSQRRVAAKARRRRMGAPRARGRAPGCRRSGIPS